jgi:hypothetical protein
MVSPSLTGLKLASGHQPYDPTTNTGDVHIGSDIPGYPDVWENPNTPGYGAAIDAASKARLGPDLSTLGGYAGQGFQDIGESMRALSATTGKNYTLNKSLKGLT